MKTLSTLIRHAVTYLVGLLVAWLTLHLTAPDDLKAATDAANALVEPLVVIAGFVAVILTRLAMPLFDKLFRTGAGESKGGTAGGLSLLAIGMTVGFMGLSLPSCSAAGWAVSYTDPMTDATVRIVGGK